MSSRKRVQSDVIVSGAIRFVGGPPQDDALITDVYPFAGPYTFHEGDLLTKGAEHWALDQPHEWPVSPIWGNGVMRNPWAFQPVQPVPAGVALSVPYDALRGIIYQGIALEQLGPLYGQDVNG